LRSIGIEDARIILEPVGRNTAPAAAVASLMVMDEDPDGLILLLPSDHAILDAAAFRQAVGVAQPAAANGLLVAFGVTPLCPETGYGYIKAGDELASTVGVRDIEMFAEKPSRENAERFLLSANFFWNNGIYLFQAKAFIREMAEHQPEMLTFCRRALDSAKRDLNFAELDEAAFLVCPSDSIDYAITE
jgi:mannose-1-phosphate guanylyltransferase / mannose-6-phosphate isomerase